MASALRVQVSPSAFLKTNLTQKTPNLLENHPSHVVVIISNGPGELTTWVKPIADRLHSKLLMQPYQNNAEISLRLVLVPCPNATGSEHKVAEQWGQFEKITTAKNFWKLLLNPKKFGFWPSQGIVIFLGGDQF